MVISRQFHRVLLCWISLLVTACSCRSAMCQTEATTVRMAEAKLAKRPPILDGSLNDPIWETARSLADFRQREPFEILSATERTEVRILYDARHVYFGIHCYDRDPKGIVATQ